MSKPSLTRETNAAVIAVTGTRYCIGCSKHRAIEGGKKPPGRTPWRCAQCLQHVRLGPHARRPRA